MPSVKAVRTAGGARLVAELRAAPRALRQDLWTTSSDPLTRTGRSGWLEWLPAFAVLWVLFAVFIGVSLVNQFAWDYGLGLSYALLLGGIQSVALIVALLRPVPAWWVVTIAMVITASALRPKAAQGEPFPWTEPSIMAYAGVLFLLAFRCRPRAAVEALAVSLLAGLVCDLFTSETQPSGFGRAVAVFALAVVLGAALRGARLARTQLAVQEEVTAEERARRTLLEERNRIARELHDVVAHHMSVISIQAQVAPHLVENPSGELRENLTGIRGNAVEALNELRRVLGVLRSDDAVSQAARHAPQPTLDRLDELVGNTRGAGLKVAVETVGKRRPLPPGVELSAFRIVQEALSNVLRHAPGADVRVRIGHHRSGLAVRVTNTAPSGPPAPARGVGHGVLGMRERAAMLGGEFTCGPTPEGGYEVLATLPLEDVEGES